MTPAEALIALRLEGEGAVFDLPGRPRVFGAGPARELARGLDGLPHPGSLGHVVLDAPGERVTTAELRRFLHRAARLLAPDGIAVWCDRDPEAAERAGAFPGAVLEDGGRHRPLRQHLELLRLFPFRPLTPRPVRDDGARLVFASVRERPAAAFSGSRGEAEGVERAEARYGAGSLYRRFDRLFEPEILDDLLYGLARLRLPEVPRVLALGCNDGLELEAVGEVLGHDRAELWGIDLAPSAIEAARARFPEHAERFLVRDLAELPDLDLPRFDAILLLNVLQCTTLDRDRLLKDLRPLVAPRGGVLVSIPDCHLGPHDVLRRPRDRRDPRADRSLVHKDVRFLARFFHRARFREIETFGSYDVFLLARGAPSR